MVMEQNLQDALGALERARVDKLREVEQLDAALRSLRGMVVVVPSEGFPTGEQPYAGMGIVEAAERVLRAAGAPLSTREVSDAMTAGGWTTRSQNKTATIYSTLTNAKKTFVRNERGQWALVLP